MIELQKGDYGQFYFTSRFNNQTIPGNNQERIEWNR